MAMFVWPSFLTTKRRWALAEVCCKISPSSKGSAAHPESDAGWPPVTTGHLFLTLLDQVDGQ